MKKRILAFLLTAAILLSGGILPVYAVDSGPITLSIGNINAKAGDNQVSVDVRMKGNTGFSGFSFCVNHSDDLIFTGAEIAIEGGYKVIKEESGYGVNLAWTDSTDYTGNGKLATLYFNVARDATPGESDLEILFREGYDCIYKSTGGTETDLPVQTIGGSVVIAEAPVTDTMTVVAGYTSAAAGASDVVVPIRIENNTGFSGFSFCVNYDKSRLYLESAEIAFEGGYKVVSYPSGYDVILAWTSDADYISDGDIAYLHFSVLNNAPSGKGYITISFRESYDSFYKTVDKAEQDIPCEIQNGHVEIADHHFGDWLIIKEATCTENGIKRRTCTDPSCGKVEETVIPKISHNYEDTVTAPTCTSRGYTTHTCSVCGSFYVDTYTDIIPHTEGEWEQSIAPGCATQGEEIQKCSVCGDIMNTRKISALGHNFGTWQVYLEPTFSQDGESRRYCSRCDAYESQRIPKLSESHTHDFSGNEEIVTAPTCTEKGSKKVYCTESSCGEYKVVEILALGHNFAGNEEITKEPTCTESGIKRIYCANPNCREYTTETIAPLGHLEGDWTIEIAPTCTVTGLEVKKCTRCGAVLQSRIIEVAGHTWNAGVVTKEPTCTADGFKTFTCTKCGETIIKTISATGHTAGEWETTKEANCSENGIKVRYCSICGDIVSEDIILATGHQYGEWTITKLPSETTPGEKERICSVCGHKETRAIDPVGVVPTITIDDIKAHLDEEITVNVKIADNPGIISMSLKIYYDNNVLELLSAVTIDFADLSYGPTTANPFVVTWEDVLSGNNSTNGTFVQLKFKVKSTAIVDTTQVTISYDEDNVFNADFNNIFFDIQVGKIEIVRYKPGDVTRDGKVNLKDYALLKQYINGWDVDIEQSVADVTGDGKINLKDLAILKQYINGWDVTLK